MKQTIRVAPAAAAPAVNRSTRRRGAPLRAVPSVGTAGGGREAERSAADPRPRFAENVRRRRVQAGLSQEALAAAARLHRTEISLLERSERDPRLTTVVRIARALGVRPATLLDGIE